MTPAQKAKKDIDDAAKSAMKVLNEAASKASDLILSSATRAAEQVTIRSHEDHDILIELRTKMGLLKDDINEIKNGTARQISDHEGRIRKAEMNITRILTFGTIILVFIGILQFVIAKYL